MSKEHVIRQVAHPNFILTALEKVAKDNGGEFESDPAELNEMNEWDSIFCHLALKDMGANFSLQQMPGCCAVLILSYVRVQPWSQENFDRVLQMVEKAAYDAGFGSVAMTQVVGMYSKMFWKQESWIKCLDRGWKYSSPFRNAKSGNLVVYLTKDMGQKGKRQGLEFGGIER